MVAFALGVASFVGWWTYLRLDLGYYFEVTIIVIDRLTLIVSGIPLTLVFGRSTASAKSLHRAQHG